MDISLWLFYGGLTGMAGTAIIGVFAVLFLIHRKLLLQQKLTEEYGEETDRR